MRPQTILGFAGIDIDSNWPEDSHRVGRFLPLADPHDFCRYTLRFVFRL